MTYEVEDPSSGQRWVFHEQGGAALEAELFVLPGGFVREHVHPSQEETFTGVEGTFVLEVDGERRAIGPGVTVVIPPRTRDGFREASEAAHVRVSATPALRLESYFRGQP